MTTLVRIALLSLALLAGAPAIAASRASGLEEREIMLGLRNGGVLWGSIAAHDETGLEFVRLDNGGKVRVPWELIDPAHERELRERLGYLDLADDEVLVVADLLRTVDGQEVIGIIAHRSEDAIHVKTANALVAIPKIRIAGPATRVRVPALELFTRGELYGRERSDRERALSAAGQAGAAAHFELAQYCERILYYERAVEHYRQAGKLAPGYRPSDRAVALLRAERKAGAQEQVDLLGEIRRERQRGNFDRALALVASFPDRYPDSPLFEELYSLRASVLRVREEQLVATVEQLWHRNAGDLVKRAARELDFEAAQAWVDGEMAAEILAAVHGEILALDPEVTPEDVRALWGARARRRTQRASYGDGTFLLGDEAARAGMAQTAVVAEKSARDAAREDLERRIRRFLEQQEIGGTARRGGGGGSEVDPAEFWARWTVAGRAQWLLAHYAESSGEVDVRGVHFRACRECAGTGVLEMTYIGAGISGSRNTRSRRLACPACQHVGIVRRISYR